MTGCQALSVEGSGQLSEEFLLLVPCALLLLLLSARLVCRTLHKLTPHSSWVWSSTTGGFPAASGIPGDSFWRVLWVPKQVFQQQLPVSWIAPTTSTVGRFQAAFQRVQHPSTGSFPGNLVGSLTAILCPPAVLLWLWTSSRTTWWTSPVTVPSLVKFKCQPWEDPLPWSPHLPRLFLPWVFFLSPRVFLKEIRFYSLLTNFL